MSTKKEVDGIINSNEYEIAPIKVLWVLKEVNDLKEKGSWDLRKFLRKRDSSKGLFSYDKWRCTYGLVCKVSWGILNPVKKFEDINNFDDMRLTKILDKIAVVNLKKTGGGPSTNQVKYDNEVKNHPKWVEKIKSQIEEINPQIIICGNTFHLLGVANEKFNDNDWAYIERIDKTHSRLWINAYHPNQKTIPHEKYFSEVINAVRKYLDI